MELTLSASSTLTITYGYDPLERLTAADYSEGSFFHYSYDAAGNRLSETTLSESNVYTYDDANRLASVNGVAYAWDANGNLLSDGVNSYTYDGANRLTGVTDGVSAVSYAYNGLGDRLQTSAGGQTNRYTLDLVSGLTQVLDDGSFTYLYGNERVAQFGANGGEYFLADALGSVRQLVNGAGVVTLTQSYAPFGEILSSSGESETSYAFTSEQFDMYTGLVYLRARFYAPWSGRFLTKDVWPGDYTRPLSLNGWIYVAGNPINQTDPTGLKPCKESGGGRYCILDKGGFIDTAHYRGGKRMAENILFDLKIDERQGEENSPLPVNQTFFPHLPHYELTYRTSLPEESLEDDELNRVALGIFMDFQIRYETFQGIDPRCYMPVIGDIFPHCSSFSNEDLVSDYLGFVDYVDKGMNFESIVDTLGGGEADSSPPAGYHPTNYRFTSFRLLEVDECRNLRVVQRDLPASLRTFKPMEAGTYWDVPKHYERTDLSQWY
jgi:RHS repeat-associated protein